MIWKWWESRPWHIWFSMLFLHNFSGWLSYTKTVCSVRLCNRSSCFCKPPARPPHWSTWMAACHAPMIRQSDIWLGSPSQRIRITGSSRPSTRIWTSSGSVWHRGESLGEVTLTYSHHTARNYLQKRNCFAKLCREGPLHRSGPQVSHSTEQHKIRKDTKRYKHSCKALKFSCHSKANTLRQPTYLLLISECMGLQLSNSWNQKLTCDIGEIFR